MRSATSYNTVANVLARAWWPVALLVALFGMWWVQLPGHHRITVATTAPPGLPATSGHVTHVNPPSTGTDKMVSVPGHPTTTTLARPIGPNNNVQTIDLAQTSSMESTCQSVPGASCVIQATMDGKTLTVSQEQTISSSDITGVILNWSADQLSVGNWQIRAVATYQGQTAASVPEQLTVTDQ